MYTVHESDVMAWLAQYEGERYHALFCDPPYHLTSITKRFGAKHAAPAKHGTDGAFSRQSRGFMGKQWDGGDIAFQPELWHALGTLLVPGAFGMAFASTRGYHRMACAIEDAGFVIHPMMVWCFSSGFPKATRVKNAAAFSGHRYGGQVLAPSLEPVVVFQRPYEGSPRDCMVRTGAGALNIEAARIGIGDDRTSGGKPGGGFMWQGLKQLPERVEGGRWAKNFVLSHSPDCTEETCAEDCPVLHMDRQTGESNAGWKNTVRRDSSVEQDYRPGVYGKESRRTGEVVPSYDDEGTASRYFFQSDYLLERLEDSDPFIYAGKASTTEREAGLHDFESQAFAMGNGALNRIASGEVDYMDNDQIDLNVIKQRRNPHPTVKPLALTQHLASLLLPPVDYAPRHLLVPFAGSGSEMIGALLAGWEHIDGIERETDYVPVAQARLDYWQAHKANLAGMKKPKAKIKKADEAQFSLFDLLPADAAAGD